MTYLRSNFINTNNFTNVTINDYYSSQNSIDYTTNIVIIIVAICVYLDCYYCCKKNIDENRIRL
jgi:hypothetical protein